MTKKTLVSETAIRELVREAFETPPAFDVALVTSDEELPVMVNPSVDDSLATVELSPVDVQFVPHDRVEFGIAVKQMTKGIPDEVIPTLYAKVREIIMDTEEECAGPEDQGDTEEMEKRSNTKLGMEEAAVRKAIRSMVREAAGDAPVGLAGGKPHHRTDLDDELDAEIETGKVWDPEEWENTVEPEALAAHHAEVDRDEDEFGEKDFEDVDDETSSEWDPEPVVVAPKKSARKESETGYGVEGDQLRKIAAELGISASGAKRLMTTGLGKLKYMSDLSDADVKDIVHGAARDWVEKLVDKGRLSDPEGRTWLRHLDIVAQNDEFRDFLHDYVRDEMKKDDEWVYDDNKADKA